MMKLFTRTAVANALKSLAICVVVLAANIQCAYIFHQPKQPSTLKKYRKF